LAQRLISRSCGTSLRSAFFPSLKHISAIGSTPHFPQLRDFTSLSFFPFFKTHFCDWLNASFFFYSPCRICQGGKGDGKSRLAQRLILFLLIGSSSNSNIFVSI